MTKETSCTLMPQASRSVVINTLLEPEWNSLIIASHLFFLIHISVHGRDSEVSGMHLSSEPQPSFRC